MARWKLMNAHYIYIDAETEWEYKAIIGGKQVRRRFTVPRFLDPNDPGDWTNRWGMANGNNFVGNEEGITVVCHAGKGQPGDIAFSGDPTPDMMPLDDEAREVSAGFTDRWAYKPDNAETSFSQTLVDAIEMIADTKPEAKPIEIAGFSEMMAMQAQSNKLIAETLAAMASQTRRV